MTADKTTKLIFSFSARFTSSLLWHEAEIIRFLGFSLSYIGIYISRPVRIFRLMKSFSQKEFFPSNLFEQRVYDFFTRIKLNKKEKKFVINN